MKVHAKDCLLDVLPEDADILCTHPMFGPESGKFGWQGLPFLYEKVRVSNNDRYDLLDLMLLLISLHLIQTLNTCFNQMRTISIALGAREMQNDRNVL